MISPTHTIERSGAGHARVVVPSAVPSNAYAVDRGWNHDPMATAAKRFGLTTAPRPEEASP